jgi:hypothetical protein
MFQQLHHLALGFALSGALITAALAAPLRLLSSFSHPQPERASALIAANGAPAQLFRIGDDVVPGVTLGEVHSRYVTLFRNQRSELLHFPAPPGR